MISKEQIDEAAVLANELASKLPSEQYGVPALTSLRIRHLLNILGEYGTNYLEVGVHRGGTFTASVAGNNFINATAVDSFASDHMDGEKAHPDFVKNAALFLPKKTKGKLIVADAFEVDLSQIPKNVDHYLYDGGHSYEDQKRALTYYLPVLADTFLYIVDDYDWAEVKDGTSDGIKECNLEVLHEKIFKGNDHDNDSFWNGFGVFLLKKKQ